MLIRNSIAANCVGIFAPYMVWSTLALGTALIDPGISYDSAQNKRGDFKSLTELADLKTSEDCSQAGQPASLHGEFVGSIPNSSFVSTGVFRRGGPVQFESEPHVFSVFDILGDFEGNTYLDDPAIIDTSPEAEIRMDLDGNILFPIDSAFGFYVVDFLGAEPKVRDGFYNEGFAGDIINGPLPGLVVSDVPTDEFQTPSRLGTWLAGIGGNSVKASTEHYVVMQHVLSDQLFPGDPNALYPLDNDLVFVGGPFDGMHVSELNPGSDDLNGDGYTDVRDGLVANENTITENIAVGNDYSVTLKDDGKPLYRWGNLVKRPNDVRINFTLDLPQEWTDNPEQLYRVTSAQLVVHHTITNNPNDQIRPEDLENEAATGRLPGYQNSGAFWLSTNDAYSGAGDFIPTGTILLDSGFADAAGISADLQSGFTNEWYTTTDREPFESDPVTGSGPRWRLLANKYGQDLPSVDIPISPDIEPPYSMSELKYNLGDENFTTIDLLDWEAGEDSPLLYSTGWTVESGVSENGLPITGDLDVSIYVKGDQKPVALYDAQLFLEYELVDDFVIGDVNGDGVVDLLDVAPFINLLSTGEYQLEADLNQDGAVNLLDVGPFVGLLNE